MERKQVEQGEGVLDTSGQTNSFPSKSKTGYLTIFTCNYQQTAFCFLSFLIVCYELIYFVTIQIVHSHLVFQWCFISPCDSCSLNIATNTLAPVTSALPDDCTWNTARCNTRWKPRVGWVSRSKSPSGINGVVESINVDNSVRRRSMLAPQDLTQWSRC